MSSLPDGLRALPPIERVARGPRADGRPLSDRYPGDVLAEFVSDGTRPWNGEPVPLSGAVTCVLWVILVADIVLGGWLYAVRSGAATCSGWPCSLATLGDRPGMLLALCGVCVAALAGAAALTRGLSRAGAVPLAVMVVGGVGGAIALVGVLALLFIVAAVLAIVLTAFVVFVDRF